MVKQGQTVILYYDLINKKKENSLLKFQYSLDHLLLHIV